jgi:hypothetical protein
MAQKEKFPQRNKVIIQDYSSEQIKHMIKMIINKKIHIRMPSSGMWRRVDIV